MAPGYVPTDEEREEGVQLIMSVHAWMLGLPDPRERIPLPERQPQPQAEGTRNAGGSDGTATT